MFIHNPNFHGLFFISKAKRRNYCVVLKSVIHNKAKILPVDLLLSWSWRKVFNVILFFYRTFLCSNILKVFTFNLIKPTH